VYVPTHFAVEEHSEVFAMVRSSGFGHLVVHVGDGFSSTPVPFVVDDELRSVRAHVARPNPIWRTAPCDALLLVPGRDDYVSPGWYPSKAEHGKVVPTWNYEVVHLHGRLVARDDGEWVLRQMRDLTDLNEASMDVPWSVDDPPAGYVEQLQRGTVGLELEVTGVEAKRKVSQNRDARDRESVIRHLGWP
jgi:transcriptional regulator